MVDYSGAVMALKTFITEAAPDQLAPLIGDLEGLKAAAWQRMTAPAPVAQPAADRTGMTADELAHVFSVPKSFFYELARRKRIPCIRLGRYVRFDRGAVEQALAEDAKTAALGTGKKRRANGALQGPATAVLPCETVQGHKTP
jgi:excisionase family DNA binding protein